MWTSWQSSSQSEWIPLVGTGSCRFILIFTATNYEPKACSKSKLDFSGILSQQEKID